MIILQLIPEVNRIHIPSHLLSEWQRKKNHTCKSIEQKSPHRGQPTSDQGPSNQYDRCEDLSDPVSIKRN